MEDEEKKGHEYLVILHTQRVEPEDTAVEMHRLKAWYDTQKSSWDKAGLFNLKRAVIIPVGDE